MRTIGRNSPRPRELSGTGISAENGILNPTRAARFRQEVKTASPTRIADTGRDPSEEDLSGSGSPAWPPRPFLGDEVLDRSSAEYFNTARSKHSREPTLRLA